MNLTICLLLSRTFVTRERIRELVVGYQGLSDAAFERTFERDKDELRALGVPIEVGSHDPLFDDSVGYRIRRADFELPPVEFTPAETAALGLAATVWDEARLAEESVRALAKLRAAGLETDPGRPAGLAPALRAQDPAFEPLWSALLSRTRVQFSYRGLLRTVAGWHLVYRNGFWYLLGMDETRGEERLFKLARIEGTVTSVGAPDAYEVPAVDVGERLASLGPGAADQHARVAIAAGAGPALLRGATPLPEPATMDGYVDHDVAYASASGLAAELASLGATVVALAPQELVDAVTAHLRAVGGQAR